MRSMAILLLLTAVLSMFGYTPFSGRDIADLTPTELLAFAPAEGGVAVKTEDGLAAWGRDIPHALEVLRAAAPGQLFLATVDHAVFSAMPPEAETLLECGLRPGTAVYAAPVAEDVKALNAYLRQRRGGVTLGALAEEPYRQVPVLLRGETGLYLKEGALP